MVPIVLLALASALVISLLACAVALGLFPWFRSGERKEGHFRPDQSTGSYRVDAGKGLKKLRASRAGSNELPLLGGPAIVVAIAAATIGTGFALAYTDPGAFNEAQWTLLVILLIAMAGFALVGFVDDWRKVYKGEGISEIQKFIGVFVVSLGAAIALNRFVVGPHISARLAYPPYSDFPVLGAILKDQHFAWVIFFLLMTVIVASSTSLAVDFSDGMDGLSGGLMLSAALSFAAILLGEGDGDLLPQTVAVLAIAGAVLGFLPFNWPSSWKARNQGWGKRRARMIMGDSGSLALGGLLALVAVISRLEFVLLFIGGVFVLEGVSALVSARILVKFFRRFMLLGRYGARRGFPHTEFPLPFLATPMHHHYDLLGWDRKRLVYGAWALGAGLGLLGVASVIGTFTWERYLARFVALLVIITIWQCGPWTKSFYIGLARPLGAAPDAPERLALFYGFPFKLFGKSLSGRVDITEITEHALTSPGERLSLWQRMSTFDARALLGYYCYRANAYEDALRLWSSIPKKNLEWRPDIAEMLAEVRLAVAMQANGDLDEILPLAGQRAGEDGEDTPGESQDPRSLDPNDTAPSQIMLRPEDLNSSSSQWRLASMPGSADAPNNAPSTPRPEPGDPNAAPPEQTQPRAAKPTAPLWNAATWAADRSSTNEAAEAAVPEATSAEGPMMDPAPGSEMPPPAVVTSGVHQKPDTSGANGEQTS
jgi:UDP-N-acetylmuramyl pentapeptide phosphotransferase/UDP-N-acetylglucosamine-1-phosphate transferase